MGLIYLKAFDSHRKRKTFVRKVRKTLDEMNKRLILSDNKISLREAVPYFLFIIFFKSFKKNFRSQILACKIYNEFNFS